MNDYAMIGSFETKPENRETLVEILLKAAEMMNELDDCQMYIVNKDAEDAGRVWVYEMWTSKAAHDNSLTLLQVRELISQAMPLLVGQPEGTSLIPMGGKGL